MSTVFNRDFSHSVVALASDRTPWIRRTVHSFSWYNAEVLHKVSNFEFMVPAGGFPQFLEYAVLPICEVTTSPTADLAGDFDQNEAHQLSHLLRSEERAIFARGLAAKLAADVSVLSTHVHQIAAHLLNLSDPWRDDSSILASHIRDLGVADILSAERHARFLRSQLTVLLLVPKKPPGSLGRATIKRRSDQTLVGGVGFVASSRDHLVHWSGPEGERAPPND